MSAPLLSRLLTREECAELNQLLEAKYIQTLGKVPPLAKTAAGQSPKAPALFPDDCEVCCNHRVVLGWEDCVVRPCPHCRPDEALAFAADRAEAAEDPWDLPSDQLNVSASFRMAALTCPSCDGDGTHCEECGCP